MGRFVLPRWIGDYHHIPYVVHGRDENGLDCWGLVRLVYKNHYGIDLPCLATEYVGTDVQNGGELSSTISAEKTAWRAISKNRRQVGDVVVMRYLGVPMHVGVVISEDNMLHTQKATGVCVTAYTGIKWANRIEGFYRHADAE